ncbi:unnamed protein product [Adineta ricciae]|uniref:NAD(P)(+)--arginine ADP-ribosyltransferase n=1 Tax=Adineta ricciae TaxID=249248 RepID=A0A815D0E2_ADIRI|nr:unnamed protein product [Adineta ricciae]CAF1518244.1 unnamed protein product [Adineta ricciae]
MNSQAAIFQQILFSEVLTTANWKKYFRFVTDAGITTVEDLLETQDETIANLKENIPEGPLDRLMHLKKNLMKIKLQCNSSFTNPLSAIQFFDQFEFVPQFTSQHYLADSSMRNVESEITKATTKIEGDEYSGLTKQQVIFIALYCQESSEPNGSFYHLINRLLRERNEKLLGLRPALFLLESGLRSLPPIEDITWRGMNTAPDLRKFVVGNIVHFIGICSTSLCKDQTLRFMDTPPPTNIHKRTLFKLRMNNGVSIQQWSCFPNEQEVVASFCSRWEVIRVEQDHEELFHSIGTTYQCDYYIELNQLNSEPLFRSNIKLTGLHLLSQIEYEKPDDLPKNFKAKFLDLFNQLNDSTAQGILESVLSSTNHWNSETKTFKNNPEDKEIHQLITQFLEGVKSLSTEFQHHGIDLKEGFGICDTHQIYAVIYLLYTSDHAERTIADFQQLGFTTDCATKLYNQEYVKQELQLVYKKLNCSGTVDSPKNVSTWLCKSRFKHYIMRDGIMVSAYELAHMSLNGAKRIFPRLRNVLSGSIQLDNYTLLARTVSYEIQYSDFVIAAAIFAVQLGVYSFQLWYGDITVRQFFKSIATSAVAVSAGFAGGIAAGFFAAGCASLLGLTCWPAGVLVIAGTTAGGLVCGGGADFLMRKLTEKFFPDGEKEELNALRKLYFAALAKLACKPDSTMRSIQKAFYRKAQATHPDKCDDKPAAEEEFKKLLAAYEIAKNYHEVLENACKTLNLPNNYTIADVKVRKGTTKNNKEQERAYQIVYRHLTYNTSKWGRLRNWFDSDQRLKLRDSKPLPIEQAKSTKS